MTLRDRLGSLQATIGWAPRPGQSRRDLLAGTGGRSGYLRRAVYDELVELHDRVARLEEQITALKRS